MWWKLSHHSFFFRFLSHPHPRNLFLLHSRKWRVASAGNFNLVLFRRLFKKLFRNVWAYPKKEMRLILLSAQRNFRNLMVKIWFRIGWCESFESLRDEIIFPTWQWRFVKPFCTRGSLALHCAFSWRHGGYLKECAFIVANKEIARIYLLNTWRVMMIALCVLVFLKIHRFFDLWLENEHSNRESKISTKVETLVFNLQWVNPVSFFCFLFLFLEVLIFFKAPRICWQKLWMVCF